MTTTYGRHPKVLDWSDERGGGLGRHGDPLMVTLVRGFAYSDNDRDDAACHVRGFYTVKEAMAAVRAAGSCSCSRCREDEGTIIVRPLRPDVIYPHVRWEFVDDDKWQVLRWSEGKGEEVLATLGGELGKQMAMHCAKFAAKTLRIAIIDCQWVE